MVRAFNVESSKGWETLVSETTTLFRTEAKGEFLTGNRREVLKIMISVGFVHEDLMMLQCSNYQYYL